MKKNTLHAKSVDHQKTDEEKRMESSAQFIHDIATPLASIQLTTTLLNNYLPTLLSAYQQLQQNDSECDVALVDIPPEHYHILANAPDQINAMAQQIKQQSKHYWHRVESSIESSDELNEELNEEPNEDPNEDLSVNLNEPLKEPVKCDGVTSHSVKKWHILVAEDDRLHQKIARQRLCQHVLDVVGDGQQAVLAAKNNHYDIILMDLSMPVMTGQQAIAAISMDESIHSLIIGLSNRPLSKNEKQQLQSQGCIGILEKPLELKPLDDLLEEYFAKK